MQSGHTGPIGQVVHRFFERACRRGHHTNWATPKQHDGRRSLACADAQMPVDVLFEGDPEHGQDRIRAAFPLPQDEALWEVPGLAVLIRPSGDA